MDPDDFHSRQVYVDKELHRGTVELPPSYFERTGIEPGHHVVVKSEGKELKLKSKSNDMLKSTEVAISPHLSLLLGLRDGEMIVVEDKTTLGDRLFDEVEDVEDVFKSGAGRAGDFLREDVSPRVSGTVEDVLDRMIDGRADEPEKDYIDVEPDLSELGSEVEHEEKPAEDVKIWTPDTDGDGKVPIFRPEVDEEDQD
jgi:hypothetical protein